MYFSSSSPDRLQIAANVREQIEKIDDSHYLGLDSISRSDLFAFAMAIGYSRRERRKLGAQYHGGFILDKAIGGRTQAILCCEFLKEIPTNELDRITDKAAIYDMGEEYANTGFHVIWEALKSGISEEDYMFSLLIELDDQYQTEVAIGTIG